MEFEEIVQDIQKLFDSRTYTNTIYSTLMSHLFPKVYLLIEEGVSKTV